jgi:hypothetical protein
MGMLMPSRPLIRLVAILSAVILIELVVVYPGVLLRGEVLTSSALGYGIHPWKGHKPDAQLRSNPVLSDDLVLFTPWDRAVRSSFASGSMPFWNEMSGCGMPLLANNQSAVLAPTHLLRWVWNSPRARTVGLLLKYFLAGTGMLLLLTRWGVGSSGALVGALAWTNASVMTTWLLYPLSETTAWFSWLLLGISGVLGVGDGAPAAVWPGRRGGAVLALSLGGMLLSGHLPTGFQLALATGAGVVVWALLERGRWGRLGRLILPSVAGLLIAMPQIVPTAGYLLDSQARILRGGASPSAARHMPLEAAWSWLVPRGFGSPELFGYWGEMNFNEATAAVGLTPLLLALVAVLLVPGRLVKALAGLVAACSALAYGLPGLSWLAERTPILQWCAGQRWIILAQWGLAALAGIGAASLCHLAPKRLLLTAGLAAAVLLVLITVHPSLRADSEPGSVEEARLTLAARAVVVSAVEVVVAGALIGLAAAAWPRLGSGLLVAVVAASGVLLSWQFNPSIPAPAIPGRTAGSRLIEQLAGTGRVLPVGWVLRPNTGLLAGVRSVTGHDDLVPRGYSRLMEALDHQGLEADSPLSLHSTSLIERSAARVIVADRPIAGQGVLTAPQLQGPTMWAAMVPAAHPVVGWYPAGIPSSGPAESLERLASGRIEPGMVMIEGETFPSESGEGGPVAVPFERDRPERVSIHLDASARGWLVFRETADPGWRVRIDGQPHPWSVADGLFMAVAVDPGRHEVEFRYRPAGWRTAVVLAFLGLAYALVTAVRPVRPRHS